MEVDCHADDDDCVVGAIVLVDDDRVVEIAADVDDTQCPHEYLQAPLR